MRLLPTRNTRTKWGIEKKISRGIIESVAQVRRNMRGLLKVSAKEKELSQKQEGSSEHFERASFSHSRLGSTARCIERIKPTIP